MPLSAQLSPSPVGPPDSHRSPPALTPQPLPQLTPRPHTMPRPSHTIALDTYSNAISHPRNTPITVAPTHDSMAFPHPTYPTHNMALPPQCPSPQHRSLHPPNNPNSYNIALSSPGPCLPSLRLSSMVIACHDSNTTLLPPALHHSPSPHDIAAQLPPAPLQAYTRLLLHHPPPHHHTISLPLTESHSQVTRLFPQVHPEVSSPTHSCVTSPRLLQVTPYHEQ